MMWNVFISLFFICISSIVRYLLKSSINIFNIYLLTLSIHSQYWNCWGMLYEYSVWRSLSLLFKIEVSMPLYFKYRIQRDLTNVYTHATTTSSLICKMGTLIEPMSKYITIFHRPKMFPHCLFIQAPLFHLPVPSFPQPIRGNHCFYFCDHSFYLPALIFIWIESYKMYDSFWLLHLSWFWALSRMIHIYKYSIFSNKALLLVECFSFS